MPPTQAQAATLSGNAAYTMVQTTLMTVKLDQVSKKSVEKEITDLSKWINEVQSTMTVKVKVLADATQIRDAVESAIAKVMASVAMR